MGGDPCHYPAGTRPFRSPEDAFELDQPLDAAVGQETRVVITIPMGLSRRDAMQKVHHACALALKQFALEAAKARLVSLQPMCTRMAYFKSCNNFSQDNMDSLGLENGKIILPNQRLAVERAEDLYTKLVDKLRTKRVKEKKIADDAKEKNVENLLKAKPEHVLEELLEAVVVKKMKENGLDVDLTMPGSDDVNSPDIKAQATAFVKAVHSKNGAPPGLGSGHNANPKSAKKGNKGKGKKQTNTKKGQKTKGGAGKGGLKGHQAEAVQSKSNHVGKGVQKSTWVEPTMRPWRVWSGSQQRSQYHWNPRTHLQKWGHQHQARSW